ncbi:MAG: hypothetical protein FGM23_07025 [Alphaproteobacteria bacterium]|nr:hypothetical protein [Alphaproteobacteria bacterium]
MRLKSYQAATMKEALALVREELGEEAIILSSARGDGGFGIKVTAAVDTPEPAVVDSAPMDNTDLESPANRPDIIRLLAEVLTSHGVDESLTQRLLRTVASLPVRSPLQGLAAALDAQFGFNPVRLDRLHKPIMLVGPPGVGKTATLAKLSAQAVLAGLEPLVATADLMRAAAVSQLETYTNALQLPLSVVANHQEMLKLLEQAKPQQLVLLDSGGINPWMDDEMAQLQQLVGTDMVFEPVLVLAAGGDTLEMAEAAEHFRAHLPISRLVITKLDLARRLGGVLSAAMAGKLYLADASMSPQVADGVNAMTPLALARLLLGFSRSSNVGNSPNKPVAVSPTTRKMKSKGVSSISGNRRMYFLFESTVLGDMIVSSQI